MRDILVMGHRGSPRAAPENTLKSYEIAMKSGVDMIELDVRGTSDGHVVCFHDLDVSSTTNGVGKVEELTLEEIRSLDAGEGQKVPLLSEAFDLVEGKIGINIDLKSIGIEALIVDLVVEREMIDSVIISSFFFLSIGIVKEINPDVQTGALFQLGMENQVQHTLDINADAIHPRWEDVTEELVDEAHRAGLRVNTWEVDDEADIIRMLECGVDGIISNVPEVAARIVDNWLQKR